MSESPQIVLHRAPELVVEVDSSNNVKIHHAGRGYLLGGEALPLLDAFHRGCTIAEALATLGPRLKSRRAVEDAVACIAKMRAAGILADSSEPRFSDLSFPRGGYDASYVHLRMLGDTVRKRAFLDAIDEIVGPDDVVLDLGTGSGILAVAAARAGARHVYAIEPSSFVAMAEQVARDNGVADRITFIRGWSSNAELPEPATVLTTDIIGNESLDMRIWETLDDARRRLMAPGGRLIPASVTASACLVCAPADVLRQYKPDDELVREWKADYGIDFGAFARASAEQSLSFHVEPHVARDWPVLSDPVTVYELDLSTAPTPIDVTRTVTVHEPGMANALLSFFEARLSPSSVLSTAPADGSDRSHWFSACWTLPRPIEVRPGDRLSFRYEYRGDGRSAVSPAPAPSPATSEAVA